MSELRNELMNKIRGEEVKMRSKNFFVFAKAVFEIALISLLLLAIFMMNISLYLPRRRFEMMEVRPERPFGFFLSNTPWHFVLLAVFVVAIIIWALYRYTSLYKKNIILLLAALGFFVLFISFLFSRSQVNQSLERRKEMKGFYPGQYERQFERRGPGMMNGNLDF